MVDCHTFPAGELGSSIAAPLARGMVAISVAGAMLVNSLYTWMARIRTDAVVWWLIGHAE